MKHFDQLKSFEEPAKVCDFITYMGEKAIFVDEEGCFYYLLCPERVFERGIVVPIDELEKFEDQFSNELQEIKELITYQNLVHFLWR